MAAQDVILGAQATRASVLKSSSSGQLGRKQVVLLTTKTFAAYKGDAGIRRAEALRQAMHGNHAGAAFFASDLLGTLRAGWRGWPLSLFASFRWTTTAFHALVHGLERREVGGLLVA